MIYAGPAGASIHHFRTQLKTDMKATEQLHHMGQNLRLDNITRGLLTSEHSNVAFANSPSQGSRQRTATKESKAVILGTSNENTHTDTHS